MNGIRETCHCGHDKTTHYLDHDSTPAERCACLAGGCECKRYASEFEPAPLKTSTEKRPDHARWCQCARCKTFVAPLAPVADEPDDVDDIYPGCWP